MHDTCIARGGREPLYWYFKFFKEEILHYSSVTQKMVGCRAKANCPLMGPGSAKGMPSVDV